MPTQLKMHTIKKGESLDRVASIYGLGSWKEVYFANCNYGLRQKRTDPGKIAVGDHVLIPPDALYYVKIKLEKLQSIREDYIKMNDKILREWSDQYSSTKSNIATIDAVGKVMGVLVSLGKLVKEGSSALKESGEALEEANNKLAKTVLTESYKPVVEIGIEASHVLAENEKDPLAIALGKQAVDTFFNWTTPSWWASKIDNLRNGGAIMKNGRLQGTDLDEINKKTIELVNKQKEQTLRNLDNRISAAQNQLLKIKSLRLGSN